MQSGASVAVLLLVLGAALLAGCSQGGKETEVPGPLLEHGSQLYNTYCVTCHGGATGGSMMDIPPRHNANGHTWHHPDCQLKEIVLNGSGEMGAMMRRMMGAKEDTSVMPAWKEVLSEADVSDILAYIKTWWTEDQRRSQAKLTAQAC